MIEVFFGSNTFELERELNERLAKSTTDVERIESETLTKGSLRDILQARSLFASQRLIVLRGLSEIAELWEMLPEISALIDESVQLILWENSLDKRSKTYKWLQANAKMHEIESWGQYDDAKAYKWCQDEAKKLGFSLSAANAKHLVERAGMNQWQLYHALEKLSLLDDVNPENIDALVEPSHTENIFNLLNVTLTGDKQKLVSSLENLRQTEDPYRLFALLSSQVVQLVATGLTQKSASEVAKDLGASPYVVGKLSALAKKLNGAKLRELLGLFAAADRQLKSSAVDPWIIIERALLGALSL